MNLKIVKPKGIEEVNKIRSIIVNDENSELSSVDMRDLIYVADESFLETERCNYVGCSNTSNVIIDSNPEIVHLKSCKKYSIKNKSARVLELSEKDIRYIEGLRKHLALCLECYKLFKSYNSK